MNLIMIFEESVIKKIIDLGKLSYPLEKCLNIIQLDQEQESEFRKQFVDSNSEVGKAYQIGKDLYDFEIETKLYHLAKTGEIKSINLLARIKAKYEEKSIENQFFPHL